VSGDNPVKVDIEALGKYGNETRFSGFGPLADVQSEMSNMAPLLANAFTKPQQDASFFAEGGVLAGIMNRHMNATQQFMNDVVKGLTYIGTAATVIATSYRNSDVKSAQSLDVVNFAFGEYGVTPPAGYKGPTKTMLQDEMDRQANAPKPAMASVGDMSKADFTHDGYEGSYYHFPDGSSITVRYGYSADGLRDGSTKDMFVTDKDGKVVSRTVTSTGYTPQGMKVTNTSTQNGPEGSPTVSTSTVEQPGGGVAITNTRPGADGKPVSTTTFVQPDQHTVSDAHQGPVEEAHKLLNQPGHY
jgi:hypothetical protein